MQRYEKKGENRFLIDVLCYNWPLFHRKFVPSQPLIESKMEYLVTYYVKNTNSAKDIFNIIPYASSVVTGSENEVLELVASKLKKNPFFRCCSVMDHCSANK